jgi:MerR family transcriptional regulator, copper efflux regulator
MNMAKTAWTAEGMEGGEVSSVPGDAAGDGNAYTIREAARESGLTEDTIRYYERIGLLPRAVRRQNTHRVYGEGDIRTMKLLVCLRKTGMPLEEMKPFLQVSMEAHLPADYPDLYERMLVHRNSIEKQIADLQQVLDLIDSKLNARGLCEHPPSDADPLKKLFARPPKQQGN